MELTNEERAIYEWQIWVEDFGAAGQAKLKGATALISRIGGLGGVVAYELAAAGIGRLILAHAGNVKPSDLNRQLLMTHDWIGKPRIESATRRLRDLNPRMEIIGVNENMHAANADRWVAEADIVIDCAPLFDERYAMNAAAMRHGKPIVECAMYDLEFHLFATIPGNSACLRCLYPETPPAWRREFPVFGAVSGTVACLGAMEAIKILAGIGTPLTNQMLIGDLRSMAFRRLQLQRRPNCDACGTLRS